MTLDSLNRNRTAGTIIACLDVLPVLHLFGGRFQLHGDTAPTSALKILPLPFIESKRPGFQQ